MEIEKFLKSLNAIVPDKEYSDRSKFAILSTKPVGEIYPARNASPVRHADASHAGWHSVAGGPAKKSYFGNAFEIIRLSATVGIVGLIITLMMGSVSYINQTFSPLGLDGLNKRSLIVEAESINSSIQITLEEIKQLDISNQAALKTIDEVTKNKPIYSELNTASSSIGTTTTEGATTTDGLDSFLIDISLSTSTDEINNLLEQIAN